MPAGYLALVLHAHLPFVRHPEHEQFLEEDWLYEAIIETYLPLLKVFNQLVEDDVPFKVTMSLTPTLAAMFDDDLLRQRFLARLNSLIELSAKELERTRNDAMLNELANMYHQRLANCRDQYINEHSMDMNRAFAKLAQTGSLMIIGSAATHGFLPNLVVNAPCVKAQISIGCDEYERLFECRPKGFWLPECGYHPAIEKHLVNEGIEFIILDARGVLHASERPRYGAFAPISTPGGVAVFGRDIESSRQVWSSKSGYPADPVYRDFYRDIGFDLDQEYIAPYVQPTGQRKMTGIKYHRVTGVADDKKLYDRERAIVKADEHAADFIARRKARVKMASDLIDRPPLIVAPYDAELFGHWWYEGPEFIDSIFRHMARQNVIEPITPTEYLNIFPNNQVAEPSISSWGQGGYSEVWLDDSAKWIYPHLHKAAEKMVAVAKAKRGAVGLEERALNQMARELLLAQSSDWAFIMKTGTMVDYARGRTSFHIANFNQLYEEMLSETLNELFLRELEEKDNLFPEIDFRVYG